MLFLSVGSFFINNLKINLFGSKEFRSFEIRNLARITLILRLFWLDMLFLNMVNQFFDCFYKFKKFQLTYTNIFYINSNREK
jgi:hypothetical protein